MGYFFLILAYHWILHAGIQVVTSIIIDFNAWLDVTSFPILLVTVSEQTRLLGVDFTSYFSLDVVVIWCWHDLIQFSLEKGSAVWKLLFNWLLGHMEFLLKI